MRYGALFLFFILILPCCTTSPPPGSGFLEDYSILRPDPDDESLLWWEKKNVDWKHYKKFMIDPVVIYFHPGAKNRQIEPDVLKKLADYFRKEVIKKIQDVYPVVDKPGPDVCRIRAAITDIVPANPFLNVITTAGIGLPLDMGGASMEAMFLDSMSEDLLGIVVDSRRGKPIDIVDGFSTWGHAKGVFREWAGLLKESLDKERNKSVNKKLNGTGFFKRQ